MRSPAGGLGSIEEGHYTRLATNIMAVTPAATAANAAVIASAAPAAPAVTRPDFTHVYQSSATASL